MPTTAAIHSFDELVAFLVENDLPHTVESEPQVVELPSKGAPLPGNLYIKWEKTVPFIQVLHFMILDVPADRVRDVETAAMRLNNLLEVGGFCFDHTQNRLYCRLTIPVFPPDGVNPATLNKLGMGVVRNAREFLDVFRAVVFEGLPGEMIADAYRERAAGRKDEQ